MLTTAYAYDAKMFHAMTAFYFDLSSNAYLADRLVNEAPRLPILDGVKFTPDMFTGEYARQQGK